MKSPFKDDEEEVCHLDQVVGAVAVGGKEREQAEEEGRPVLIIIIISSIFYYHRCHHCCRVIFVTVREAPGNPYCRFFNRFTDNLCSKNCCEFIEAIWQKIDIKRSNKGTIFYILGYISHSFK